MESRLEICKWYNNAQAPVMLMVDDLANVWVDLNGNGQVELGEDWGYAQMGTNSSLRYLLEVVLADFPQVKVTFFTPVGIRAGVIQDSDIQMHSDYINATPELKTFWQKLHEDPRFEVAYHGTTHGIPGRKAADFVQEWEAYQNLAEALATIKKGKAIYHEVFGTEPQGGKYCGYSRNDFSDTSIDLTGFRWWCRYWNRGFQEAKVRVYPPGLTRKSCFDLTTFGKKQVVDIPSTLNGGLFTDLYTPQVPFVKKLARGYLLQKRFAQIADLLKRRGVISIQEHIAPSRNDGRRQQPNIFDDCQSLQMIFRYLKKKQVWYCTGTELANYYLTRINTRIVWQNSRQFCLEQPRPDLPTSLLTFKIVANCQGRITLPSGESITSNQKLVNLPILKGIYHLE